MTKITVIVDDEYSGYQDVNPLIYTVDVANPNNEQEVLAAVIAERREDLGLDDCEELDLTLRCAFAGDISPIVDWRG